MLTLSGIVIAIGSAVSIYTIRKTRRAEESLHE